MQGPAWPGIGRGAHAEKFSLHSSVGSFILSKLDI
jgi:hypothetical protein